MLVLNALVLPGAGHVYGGKIGSGALIGLSFTGCVVYLIFKLVRGAYLFFGSGGDLFRIGDFYSMLWDDAGVRISLFLAALVWLVGVLDGFRVAGGK